MKKKGRGLSYDEKRDKMLKIFHDSRSVFNYEEIEKLSIKAGIPFPSVKQILNSLKADSLIQCEKIGAGVFYWSFPSKAMQIKVLSENWDKPEANIILQIRNTTAELAVVDGDCGQVANSIHMLIQQERQELISQQEELLDAESQLEKEIGKYIRFDPERVELLKKENKQLKKKVNAQTDNLEQIKKYIKQQQPGTKNADIQEAYGIPADLQYVD